MNGKVFAARFISICFSIAKKNESLRYRIYLFYISVKIFLRIGILKRGSISLFGYRVITINPQYFFYTFSEIFIYEVYKSFLDSSIPRIFDVGANIGLATIYFKIKYPSASVSAFEPDQFSFHCLKKNSEKLSNVSLYNVGLNSEEGFFPFYSLPGDPRSSFLSCGLQESEAECHKLSKYIDGTVDLLKIDIEGLEYEVLKGLKETISNIKLIIIEIHGDCKKIMDLLQSYNFDVKIYENYNRRIDGNYFLSASQRN